MNKTRLLSLFLLCAFSFYGESTLNSIYINAESGQPHRKRSKPISIPFPGSSKIPLTHISPLNQDGNLTKQAVQSWFLKQHLINKGLLSKECLNVTKLLSDQSVTERSAKSLTAEQVFFISTPCLPEHKGSNRMLFALKLFNDHLQAPKEIANLMELKKNFNKTRFKKNYPKLAFPEEFYRYKPSPENETYKFFSLIHAAKGESLYTLFNKYDLALKTNPDHATPEKRTLLLAAHALGTGMALLHSDFLHGEGCNAFSPKGKFNNCRTQTHGDLHPKNIFWDGKQITLIDIETMASPNAKGAGGSLEEIGSLYGYLHRMVGAGNKLDNPDYEAVFKQFWETFFKAYVVTYQKKVRKEHLNDFVQNIMHFAPMLASMKGLLDHYDTPKSQPMWEEFKEKKAQYLQ